MELTEEKLLKRKKLFRIILIISTVLFALAIIPGVAIAVLSVMIFDSGVNNTLIVLYAFIATFPLICLLSFISWVFYRFKKYGLAVFISFLPILNIIGTVIMFIIKKLA